jgi:hypothetical protein
MNLTLLDRGIITEHDFEMFYFVLAGNLRQNQGMLGFQS